MKTLKDFSNQQIREFLGCSVVFASYVKHGKRTFPRKRAVEFSEKFGVPLKNLIDNNR